MQKKVVIIGGGSYAWTPRIMADMLLDATMREHHFCLYDINLAAVTTVHRFVSKLRDAIGAPARLTVTDDQDEAFKDADFFIVTISTGGLDAMAHDLAIPEDYSIYHTVGDTCGPGGWSRAIRNFKVFTGLAEKFNAYAPTATILNYTNPMTTLTDVLARTCEGPVVGLCHGVFENLELIRRTYNVESEDDLSVVFGGLNHFFWIKKLAVKGRPVLNELHQRAQSVSLSQLQDPKFEDAMGFSSHHELGTKLFRETGLMPYVGDRHTCEFMADTINDRATMETLKLVRTSIQDRRDKMQLRLDNLEAAIAGDIPEHFFSRSRETAVDITRARIHGRRFVDVGNVPNQGQMPDLPENVVVETLVVVDGNGFTPITAGHFPDPIAGYLQRQALVYQQTVDACFSGDRERALQALALDPVCSHLDAAQIREMGTRLLDAHAAYVPF